jgi:hypothetical protein
MFDRQAVRIITKGNIFIWHNNKLMTFQSKRPIRGVMRTTVGLILLLPRVYADSFLHIHLIQGGYTEPVSISNS